MVKSGSSGKKVSFQRPVGLLECDPYPKVRPRESERFMRPAATCLVGRGAVHVSEGKGIGMHIVGRQQ
eukprot:1033424-Amphidinium_carterae.4